jgi:uncharacterized protein
MVKSSPTTSELVRAIEQGNIDTFARILNEKPDLNAADSAGWTPLFHAVASGDVFMASELLKHGADVSLKDNAGWTPLSHARLDGRREICKLLAQREFS